jgi:hypothetical protein
MDSECTIMRAASAIVRDTQHAIRRELDRRGKHMKVIGFDSEIPYRTLLSYFPSDPQIEPHALTVAALRLLCGRVPSDLLSLLLPDGWQIVRAPEEIDHAAVEQLALDFYAGTAADKTGPGDAPVSKLRVAA